MPINTGTKELEEIYIGDTEIIQIFVGENEVWGKGKCIYLGEGTTFNIASIYEDYANLTIDDFFITPREGTLLTASYRCPTDAVQNCTGCNNFGDSISFSKSYNASTGIFNCSYRGNVFAWLIPNSDELISKGKIVNLGSLPNGQSIDIKPIESKYSKLTKNNFLVRTYPMVASNYICCSWHCDNSCGTSKSYDVSTGMFKGGTTQRRDHRDYSRNYPPQPVTWFLIRPSIMR